MNKIDAQIIESNMIKNKRNAFDITILTNDKYKNQTAEQIINSLNKSKIGDYMKFDIGGYYKPTPAGIRKVGDVMQYGAQVATGVSIVNEKPELGLVVMIIGAVGKILSNFFVEE
jgi:hypothetical protein